MTIPTDFSKYPEYTDKFLEVYLAELDYVVRRRKNMGLPSEKVQQVYQVLLDKQQNLHDDIPSMSVKTGLVGLALSGGGIRSATFNLGLLQALAKKKVLHCCDYLSTVSGGGYIGACLSSLLADTEETSTKAEQFPLRDEREQGEERKEVNHLRTTRNYLGLSAKIFNLNNWYVLGLNLSGKVLINIIPFAMIILFTLWLYMIEPYFYSLFTLHVWIEAIAITLTGLSLLMIRCVQQQNKVRHFFDSLIGYSTLSAILLVIILSLFDLIYTQAWQWALGSSGAYHLHDIVIFLLIVAIVMMMGERLFFSTRQLLHIMLPIALITFLITLTISLLTIVYHNEYAYIQKSLKISLEPVGKDTNEEENAGKAENSQPTSPLVSCCWQQVDNSYRKNEGYFDKVVKDFKESNQKRKEFFSDPSNEACRKALEEKQAPFKVKNREEEYQKAIVAECSQAVQEVYDHNIPLRIQRIMTVVIVMLILIILSTTNMSYYSFLHCFYRNRLSKTFLIRRREGKIQLNDDVLLSDLHHYDNGPYHLLNVTLNVPTSTNPLLKGRGTDFFVFSKFYCGAESTGYKRTDCYRDGKTNISLATAMAISGAAASPEMGTSSNPFVAMIMTSMNYRLNRWMPNPNSEARCQVRFWPIFYFRELLMAGGEKDHWVNLSDGGHYENLGIYPLLKRRCRVIIAADAGADPEFQMKDFANLQRKARIDLGVEIVITDMKKLRLNDEGHTQTHFVVGEIRYSEGERGVLLYIKASMTGEEPEDILSYRRRHSSFPHETTLNQFFNEDQFESYRKLGQLIGKKVFQKEIHEFEELEKYLFDKVSPSKNKDLL